MKYAGNNKPQSNAYLADFNMMKDRRKAYYHGKYNKEVFSIVLLLACIAMFVVRQGA
ncbi:hypothetical protein [Paraglaciecola hydrolytica]|uniref:hypothetical protein n=1 Tax=Paraglaciecola hydrolytica TaxID=1799789 RepID=UPI000B1EB90B|nr:hypothetical protein [Paraglaciecola hydrolytica]